MTSILGDAVSEQETALALGFFDGVHRGHWAVIDAAVSCARQKALLPCVFTFTTGISTPKRKTGYTWLTTQEEKSRLLAQRGVQRIISPDFEQIRGLTPQAFVTEVLVGQLRAKVLCCGEDFHFGKNAAAGVEQLAAICAPLGVQLQVVGAVLADGLAVSSTRIRGLIAGGEVAQAARLLGRPFGFDAQVTQGKRLGRTLGFPTINQRLPAGMTLPAPGVYATLVQTEEGCFNGVTNIGPQPTVGGQDTIAETYILDYSGDLYQKWVRVDLVERIRAVVKFDTVEQLRRQVEQDAQSARRILADCTLHK